MAVPKWLRGRPLSLTQHVLFGFCFLAFGVYWLALGAVGSSDGFRVWYLVLGVGWVMLSASHFVAAFFRQKQRRAAVAHRGMRK